jgi:uncharacterized protein with PQ loop repeat
VNRGGEYNEFIGWYFSQCVYTTSDYVGFFLGLLNIGVWLFIHVPQLIKSFKSKGKGLSPLMLGLWLSGDITGLAGLLLTNQGGVLLATQIYYLCMDSLLVLEYLYFTFYYKEDLHGSNNTTHVSNSSCSDSNNIDTGKGYVSHIDGEETRFRRASQSSAEYTRYDNQSNVDINDLGVAENSFDHKFERNTSFQKSSSKIGNSKLKFGESDSKSPNYNSSKLYEQHTLELQPTHSDHSNDFSTRSPQSSTTLHLAQVPESLPQAIAKPSASSPTTPIITSNNNTLFSNPSNLMLMSTCLLGLVFISPTVSSVAPTIVENIPRNLHHLSNIITKNETFNQVLTLLQQNVQNIQETLSTDPIPSCTGGALTPLESNIGTACAYICMVIYAPSRVPQVLHNRKQKSTYGLSKAFIGLAMVAAFLYGGSILIPISNWDRTNGYRSKAFWLQTFPYLVSCIVAFVLNCIITFQIWLYREKTKADAMGADVSDETAQEYEDNDGRVSQGKLLLGSDVSDGQPVPRSDINLAIN